MSNSRRPRRRRPARARRSPRRRCGGIDRFGARSAPAAPARPSDRVLDVAISLFLLLDGRSAPSSARHPHAPPQGRCSPRLSSRGRAGGRWDALVGTRSSVSACSPLFIRWLSDRYRSAAISASTGSGLGSRGQRLGVSDARPSYEPEFATGPVRRRPRRCSRSRVVAWIIAYPGPPAPARGRCPDSLLPALADVLDETLDDLRAEADPRRAVIAAYARMERALAAYGLPRSPAEAPDEYLQRILADLDGEPPLRPRA